MIKTQADEAAKLEVCQNIRLCNCYDSTLTF